MKTTVDKLSPTRAKLTIAVPPDELKPTIDAAYKQIAGQVSIPGFRKGKVPPPVIDQRVGRGAVIEQAVNDGLDGFYRSAVTESGLDPIGRPEADVAEWPNEKDFSGDLTVTIEVDVRPEVTLPDYAGLELTVDPITVQDEDVQAELDTLRARFGTLVTVDRPAKAGDFTQLDLVARIDGEEVDNASGISYEIGSGELIEGLDEALDALSKDESTTFTSRLLGGDHEGEEAEVTVTLTAVKERELPAADDDFAQMASEFDTIDELTESLREQVARTRRLGQGTAARDALTDRLIELADIPVPEKLVEDEVHRHLEEENRLEDDEHRAEVTASTEKNFRVQVLLDEIVKAEKVQPTQDELTQYLVQGATQYGMSPEDFVKALSEGGQIPQMAAEVARNKALAIALGRVTVKDTSGAVVDLGEFVAKPEGEDGEAEEAQDAAPAADEKVSGSVTPAEKAASTKSRASKSTSSKSTAKKSAKKSAKAAEDAE